MSLTMRALGVVFCVYAALDVSAQRPPTGSVAGRISLPDGTPAAESIVVAAKRGPDGDLTVVAETASRWDGRYELVDVPIGEFFIGARLGARPTTTPREAVLTLYPGVPHPDAGKPVAVMEDIPTEGIDIWLAPAPQRFSVSGRVFWPDGSDIDNIAIEYGGTGVRSGVWYVDDPGGLFTIEGVSPGTIVLLAHADSDEGRLIGLATTDVSVGSAEEVRIVLRRPGVIRGRVVLERNVVQPAPMRLFAVQTLLKLSPLYPADEGVIGADGHFQIDQVLGQYTFQLHGVPDQWRVLRVLRDGSPVPDGRIFVGPGALVSGIEVVVGEAT